MSDVGENPKLQETLESLKPCVSLGHLRRVSNGRSRVASFTLCSVAVASLFVTALLEGIGVCLALASFPTQGAPSLRFCFARADNAAGGMHSRVGCLGCLGCRLLPHYPNKAF